MKGLLCFLFRVWVRIFVSLPFVLERCAYRSKTSVSGESGVELFKCGGTCNW